MGLGALGVITEVELQCVPAFRLHAKEFGADLLEVLERIDEDVEAHDHVDMHWFPLTDRVLVKHNDRVGDDHPRRAAAAVAGPARRRPALQPGVRADQPGGDRWPGDRAAAQRGGRAAARRA